MPKGGKLTLTEEEQIYKEGKIKSVSVFKELLNCTVPGEICKEIQSGSAGKAKIRNIIT